MKSRTSLDELEDLLKSTEHTWEKAFLDELDPMLFFNEDGKLIGKNRKGHEYWGDDHDFVPPPLLREVAGVQETGIPYRCEKKNQLVRIETKQGIRYFLPGIFRLLSESTPCGDADVRASRIVACILRDETGWELSERIRRILFTCISHELNTPLTSARLTLHLLSEGKIGGLNEQQLQLVNGAREDLDREITSISNLLELIRSDALNFRKAEVSPLNVKQLIEESIAEFSPQINTLKLVMKRRYSANMPELLIDHNAARLAVSQILACFIKYSVAGSKLDVVTRQEDRFCRIEFVIRTDCLLDFLSKDLFSRPIESEQMRSLSCAELCMRVAGEIIKDQGGVVGTGYTEEETVVYIHVPLSHVI